MKKSFEFAGQETEFRFDAFLPVYYNEIMGEDYFRAHRLVLEKQDNVSGFKLCYAAMRYANPENEISFREWLENIDDIFVATNDMTVIIGWWITSHRTSVTVKKKSRPTEREMTAPLFVHRAAQVGLSVSDLKELSVGFVFDVIAEVGNDECEYKELATQEDFDKF